MTMVTRRSFRTTWSVHEAAPLAATVSPRHVLYISPPPLLFLFPPSRNRPAAELRGVVSARAQRSMLYSVRARQRAVDDCSTPAGTTGAPLKPRRTMAHLRYSVVLGAGQKSFNSSVNVRWSTPYGELLASGSELKPPTIIGGLLARHGHLQQVLRHPVSWSGRSSGTSVPIRPSSIRSVSYMISSPPPPRPSSAPATEPGLTPSAMKTLLRTISGSRPLATALEAA
jgi:hypothetical protein